MSQSRQLKPEIHIETEHKDIVLLAVEENGEIIGYAPYHRAQRAVISMDEEQLYRLFKRAIAKASASV